MEGEEGRCEGRGGEGRGCSCEWGDIGWWKEGKEGEEEWDVGEEGKVCDIGKESIIKRNKRNSKSEITIFFIL